jgi:hypothetical protein
MSRYLPLTNIRDLERGDIIRGKSTGIVYVVTGNYGNRVTAATTTDVTHAIEWEIFHQEDDRET